MIDCGSRFWWWLGFATGTFTTVFLFASALALWRWQMPVNVLHHLKDWQTLIVGLLGVAVAVATIVWLERQIQVTRVASEDQMRTTRELNEDHRERKQYADRAAMPAALATLIDYGRANLNALRYMRAHLVPSGTIHGIWTPPEAPDFPSDAAETIRSCLETTNRNEREPLKQILLDLQIMHSRLRGTIREFGPSSDMLGDDSLISDYIVEALEFMARCNTTVPYARGTPGNETPPAKVSLDRITSEAHFENLRGHELPEVFRIIEERFTND